MIAALRSLALVGLLASGALATQILVPSQVTDLQVAINLASPGDVIRVEGGTWFDIVVDKPLVIVGREGNEPLIQCTGALGTPFGAVTLAGPGHGTVELVNLRIEGGPTDGSFFGQPFEGVVGGGFDELRLLHCDIEAGEWFFPTGVGEAGDGVDVNVPYTVVADCRIDGGEGTDDGSGLEGGLFVPDGGRGVATTGDLIVSESVVRGGDGLDGTIFDGFLCPPSATAIQGGAGGAGVAVGGTYYRTSGFGIVQGGQGATITCQPTGQQYVKPGGPLASASVTQIVGGLLLTDSQEIELGQSYFLINNSVTESSSYFLVVGFPAPPLQVGLKGKLFLDPDLLFLFTLPGCPGCGMPPSGINLTATSDPAFVGVTIGFQLFQDGKLSNPVFGTHVAP